MKCSKIEKWKGRAAIAAPCRVVQHLPNNFTANAGVRTAFYFHQSRHCILIQKQMIQCCVSATPFTLSRSSGFAPFIKLAVLLSEVGKA
jgi:hypothetical protein